MRELGFAFKLPAIQLVIAAALLQWGYHSPYPRGYDAYVATPRLICRGLNAPALLIKVSIDPTTWGYDWFPRWALGFDTGDLLFLAGVVLVWYFVGPALDRAQAPRPELAEPVVKRVNTRLLAVRLLMSALGALLAYMGVVELRPYRYTNFFAPVEGLLTLLWSVGLMIFGIKGVVNAIRPHRREGSVV